MHCAPGYIYVLGGLQYREAFFALWGQGGGLNHFHVIIIVIETILLTKILDDQPLLSYWSHITISKLDNIINIVRPRNQIIFLEEHEIVYR